MKKSILLVAAAIGMLTASCNKDLENLTQTPITISATYDGEGEKVAYTEDGANITATWEAGDELIVCWNNHKNTLTLSSGAGTSSATFTGAITGTPSANSTLVCFVKDSKNPGAVTISDNGDYLYTSDAFLTQDGSMDSAASRNLYYGTCFYGDGTNISCTFSVNTSMMKFKVYAPAGISEGTPNATLTYKSGNTELAKATFTVGTDGINTIYLTIPAGHYTGEQTLVYHSGDITETETLSSTQANFVAGQTYSKTLLFSNTPVVDPLEEPLTFDGGNSEITVIFTPGFGMTLPLEYSIDEGLTWSTYTGPVTGVKISFRGDNAAYCNSNYINSDDESRFSCSSGQFLIYGNIMSLINSTDYATITTMTAENKNAFRGLFSGITGYIYKHQSKTLILPALTLAEGCYHSMFKNCNLLMFTPELPATELAKECYTEMFYGVRTMREIPELPATTLAESCYKGMFYGTSANIVPELPAITLAEKCYEQMFESSGIRTAPNLPATILAKRCYKNMFKNCRSITTAPILSGTTMADSCCMGMFYGCTNMTTAPNLPATLLDTACYQEMFYGCTNLTTVPVLPAITLFSKCYNKMFSGCTGLTTPPELPATTIASECYANMFSGCTELTSAPELPASTLFPYCYMGMFSGCTKLTTAPDLLATTMEDGCYASMFSGCIRLNYVKCLATYIMSNYNWLYGVTASGTFIKASGTEWERSANGIPSGWTVQEE